MRQTNIKTLTASEKIKEEDSDDEENTLALFVEPLKMNIDGRRKSQVGPLPDSPLSCWQKLDNYVWLGAHQYFYICCIHEYGGPNCIRTSPNMLILLRLILLITISPVERVRHLWLSTFLIRKKKNFKNLNLRFLAFT